MGAATTGTSHPHCARPQFLLSGKGYSPRLRPRRQRLPRQALWRRSTAGNRAGLEGLLAAQKQNAPGLLRLRQHGAPHALRAQSRRALTLEALNFSSGLLLLAFSI